MKIKPFSGPGSTRKRKQFWNEITEAVNSSQKVKGQYTTVSEHVGQGTVINVGSIQERRGGGIGTGPGACCFGDLCSILNLADCSAAGGIYRGEGIACNPCGGGGGGGPGACCFDGGTCSTLTFLQCFSAHGHYLGEGVPCINCGHSGDSGACCNADGSCTTTTFGGCSGTWHSGEGCGACTGGEPTGACCASAAGGCTTGTFGACGGIYFGDGSLCSWVGSCEHAFCGPTSHLCACPPGTSVPPNNYTPAAVCCLNVYELCGTCWIPTGGQYVCCCCHHDPNPWYSGCNV